jgi:hypothetical protein
MREFVLGVSEVQAFQTLLKMMQVWDTAVMSE